MAKRICPGCRKIYAEDTTVCSECGIRLADIEYDFELALSMIKVPVLLSNNRKVDAKYLEKALKKRNIPYFSERMQQPVPTGNIRERTIEILAITNYYVDHDDWDAASEALAEAMEADGNGSGMKREDGGSPVRQGESPVGQGESLVGQGESPLRQKEESLVRRFFEEPSFRMNVFIIGSVLLFAALGILLGLISSH